MFETKESPRILEKSTHTLGNPGFFFEGGEKKRSDYTTSGMSTAIAPQTQGKLTNIYHIVA